MNITYFGHSISLIGTAWHTRTLPTNGHSHSEHHTNNTNTHILQVRSQRPNCCSSDNRNRVQSLSKDCKNLHNHHDEWSIPSDLHYLKSFITFHVFSWTYPCRYSKCCWERQLSFYLIPVTCRCKIRGSFSSNVLRQNMLFLPLHRVYSQYPLSLYLPFMRNGNVSDIQSMYVCKGMSHGLTLLEKLRVVWMCRAYETG